MSSNAPIISWDGESFPEELRKVPPGRYELVASDGKPNLTPEEEEGIMTALDQIDAGQGKSLADVLAEVRAGKSKE